ncbi:MAG: TonB C-terminal domain-containing protein [Acidobacteria bacterium]|nr:TonB C-terminal domain-containing protein [Acidobacteriota bacterium]
MESESQQPVNGPVPQFLVAWDQDPLKPRPRRAAMLSLLAHAVLALILILLPAEVWQVKIRQWNPLEAALQRSTPLVAPRFELTQKDPNQGRISKEINLQALTAPRMAAPPSPPPAVKPQENPTPARPAPPQPQFRPAPPQPQILAEPPKIEQETRLAQGPPPTLGNAAQGLPGPPPPPPKENPKLTFETPGAPSGIPTARGRIAPPKPGLEEAIRGAAHAAASSSGGVVVSDLGEQPQGLGDIFRQQQQPGRTGSSLELLSDPQGVDFRPYLRRILLIVKRNWMSVIPESARFGRQGKVAIQFAISRDGRVPKLVIAMGSGTDALDRAAVAGISASNPFPPLPAEFKGDQVRLQFSFLYNMPQ